PHHPAIGDGLRNHVPERTRAKPARGHRICWRARSQRRGRNATARGRSRAPEILSGLGKCRLWNGGRRGHLRYRTRSIRLFPGGGDARRSASHLFERTKTPEVSDVAAQMTIGGVDSEAVNNLCTNPRSSSEFVHSFL